MLEEESVGGSGSPRLNGQLSSEKWSLLNLTWTCMIDLMEPQSQLQWLLLQSVLHTAVLHVVCDPQHDHNLPENEQLTQDRGKR